MKTNKAKKHSKEFLSSEELLNELKLNLTNSMALNECLNKFIQELNHLKELNKVYYHLLGIEQIETINNLLYSQLQEATESQEKLYKHLEANEG